MLIKFLGKIIFFFFKQDSPPSESLENNLDEQPLNNFWVECNEGNTIFVFVHGFFSNSRKCWTSKNGTFWPNLISSDTRFDKPSIYMAGYYTDVDSTSYDISDCANEIFDSISSIGLNNRPAPLEKTNIVFICHSLGGIIARYVLEKNREAFSNKAIGLVLMASPSYGADLASGLSFFSELFSNKIGKQLKTANPALQDLDSRFKSLLDKKTIKIFVGAEAIEHHFPIHWKWLPGFKPIVTKESASRYFDSRVLPNTNHSTCVKPDSHSHAAHKFLVSIYTQKFKLVKVEESKKTSVPESQKKNSELLTLEASVLFEIYDSSLEEYYVSRKIDSFFADSLNLFSIWVHGESGMGKTSTVRRKILQQSRKVIQAYIGASISDHACHTELLQEIYYSVSGALDTPHKHLPNTHQVISELAELLSANAEGLSVFLVLDEVPFLENNLNEMSKFITSICRLNSAVKQKCSRNDLRFIVTSIFDPSPFIENGQEKISEQLKFLEFTRWTNIELNILINKIHEVIPSMSLKEFERDDLLRNAYGSPRFIKTFYKNLHLDSDGKENAYRNAIEQTRLSLGMHKK
ncbi:AAA family ATPase [Undibacterium sp. Ji83W]|uniref:alpha/beta hydrolase n=1 Tax=Undibacterium sp. Ji83W TaxID=3413043 RepID=UPI003BF0552E